MPAEHKSPDVIVVGAGIIGMSIAWRAVKRGMSVLLLERGTCGAGTSSVAAGMLAPVAEAEFGEGGRRLVELGLASAARWPGFAEELEQASGVPVGFLKAGTMLVAADADEAAALERELALRHSLGLEVQALLPSEAREREPALAPVIRAALEAPADHSVDPRLALKALEAACRAGGVEVREQVTVERLALSSAERVQGVVLDGGEELRAGCVVLAAGPWSESIGAVPERARVPVRPVRGQILRLRDRSGAGLLSRVLRFDGGYLVPRADGAYVLGATVEERGYELAPTAGGVYELLRDAHEILPGISELEIEELSVGLRPGTPDNVPLIGSSGVDGLVWATGHYRNGILLAPLTADIVAGLLADEEPDPLLELCRPSRFAGGDPQPGPQPLPVEVAG
jgi:glycine oxidase